MTSLRVSCGSQRIWGTLVLLHWGYERGYMGIFCISLASEDLAGRNNYILWACFAEEICEEFSLCNYSKQSWVKFLNFYSFFMASYLQFIIILWDFIQNLFLFLRVSYSQCLLIFTGSYLQFFFFFYNLFSFSGELI